MEESVLELSHIVSVGSECRVAYNLRRFYNFGDAYPFDWWISKLTGIVSALTQMSRIYRVEELEPILDVEGNIQAIGNRSGSIRLHHEFPRNYAVIGSPVANGWEGKLDKPQTRFEYLVAKFDEMSRLRQRVLWVRYGLNDIDIKGLAQVIEQQYPGIESYYLLINSGVVDGESEHVYYRSLTNDEKQWRGSRVAWDGLLESLPFSLKNHLLKPFSENIEPDGRDERPY